MVNKDTLKCWHAGITTRRNTVVNSRKLTVLKEETIIYFIIDLYMRVFLLCLSGVKDIANQLLYVCDALPIGKNWTSNFIKHQLQLCIY